MIIGLMADSHDRVPAIRELLERMVERGVGMVLHAGDYCSPFSLAPFLELSIPFAGVFGRNDGDREGLKAYAAKGVGIELYESPHSIEVGGRRILLVHDLGRAFARVARVHRARLHTHAGNPRARFRRHHREPG